MLAATSCWALQGWLPRGWALLGAFIGLDLYLFSYWMNSYWGGGSYRNWWCASNWCMGSHRPRKAAGLRLDFWNRGSNCDFGAAV